MRTSTALRKGTRGRKKYGRQKLRVTKRIVITSKRCPGCKGTSLTTEIDRKELGGCPITRTKRAYDLILTPAGVRRKVIECRASVHRCLDCGLCFIPEGYQRLDRHFHGLKSWAMYSSTSTTLKCWRCRPTTSMVRIDDDDEVYRTAAEKYRAILNLIDECKERAQPVLVGTTSIEKSEQLAEMLRQQGWEQHDFADPNAFAPRFRRRRRLQGQGVRHPQCPLPRAGGLHHRAGGGAWGGDDRHQHGGAGHRHPARRQCRHAHPAGTGPRSKTRARASTTRVRRRSAPRWRGSRRRRWWPAGCSCWAPSGTRAGASTTSCAAAPAGRATPGIPSSSCRWKTT